MISSSRLAELQHVPPAWKLSAVQSQERFDRENAQRGGKPRRGHETHCPAARIEATKKTSAGGTEPGPPARTKRKRKCSEAPFIGVARVLGCPAASATPGGRPPGGHVLQPTRGSSSPRRCPTNAPINPNLDSSSKTDLETCGKYRVEKKAFRARADAAQSAPQGGTEPRTTRFRDGGRRTTGPPAPRRGPGTPTAQPRPRGPDLESAQI